ncbi:ComX [Streptococcus gordonii str. Challis substr. CH1]|uniref:ComX n=2 Tax=Streptococcus gordonii TaxID=1302 RepID=A8AZY3_STRGC|nr:ComX [Streptococcus gordonii]ABV10737.1 ComX [Streptococcus gordonii str. Challis substr. CH1]
MGEKPFFVVRWMFYSNIKKPSEIREVLNDRVNLGRYRKPCPERWLGQTSHGN